MPRPKARLSLICIRQEKQANGADLRRRYQEMRADSKQVSYQLGSCKPKKNEIAF